MQIDASIHVSPEFADDLQSELDGQPDLSAIKMSHLLCGLILPPFIRGAEPSSSSGQLPRFALPSRAELVVVPRLGIENLQIP